MTERMRDAYIRRDVNSQSTWLSDIQPASDFMNMGDGTVMEEGAFSESIPMMSYSPEELGINMDATPHAVAIAATNPYPYTDRQEVEVASSPIPDLSVVKEDFVDGGVEFSAEDPRSVIRQMSLEIKDYLKSRPGLCMGIGFALGAFIYPRIGQYVENVR